MKAGQLRHLVTIESLTETVDTVGQAVKTWATFTTAYASVEPLTGREYFSGQQIKDTMTVKIKIRYQAGITEKMRVSWNSKLYNIEGPPVNVFERDAELYLLCSEGLNNG